MQVIKKELSKSQIELTIEISLEEFGPYIEKGAQKVSEQVKIEGFRPGKVPTDILKQKIGEMTILEEAANIAVRKTIDEAIIKNTVDRQAVGQPQVNITKLAPGNAFEYKVIVSILPEIVLGKYKELGIKVEEPTVSEAELEKAILELREIRAHEVAVDRPIEDKDKIVADVKISLDMVPVENGQHQDLAIILGKEYFVPGFDKKIIGAKKGDVREFVLEYPKDHHQQNLAGKNVEFQVTIKEVFSRDLHEMNDEFASHFGLKNLAELKKAFKDNLLHEKKKKTENKHEAEMLEKIIKDSKFSDVPDILVDSEAKNMVSELEQSIVRQGGKFEDYLQHIKKDYNSLMLDFAPNAVKRVKSALIIREIAKVEKIEVSDEEMVIKKEALKVQYAGHQDVLKMFAEPGYDSYLRNVLSNEKVINKLKEWNYARTGSK